MRLSNKPSFFETIRLSNKNLLRTPLWTAITLLISGVGFGYYSLYTTQKYYESIDIYKVSLVHLNNYKPISEHVGTPIKVKYIKEASFNDETVTMVVPFRGPKGKANLIINGRRSSTNEVVLDHLDVEFDNPPKVWTFLREKTTETAQSTLESDTSKATNGAVE